MSLYQHILLAVDFSEYHQDISEKASEIARQNNAKLTLLHVVDNLPITDASYGPIIPFDTDLTEQLMDNCKKRMAKLGAQLQVPEERQIIQLGSPRLEILGSAEELAVDLIVLGSHGKHGLALLLGSTANAVLHGAQCDVLAVRINHND